MRVYLDTDLWNVLCSNSVDPDTLLRDLDETGWSLTLGQHVVFEMLKSFPANSDRGKELFSYLRSYFNLGLRSVAKDVYESLVAEMWALKGVDNAGKFLEDPDLSKVREEVDRLSKGDVKGDWFKHVQQQIAAQEVERATIKQTLTAHPNDVAWLTAVKDRNLAEWLSESTKTPLAMRLLQEHLRQRFPTEAPTELLLYARELLRRETRSAISIVKADLYMHWRTATRGSLKKDLLDDSYHVLSSAYCDAYATGESKQIEYAAKLLPAGVKVLNFDRQIGIRDWLTQALNKISCR